MAELFRKPFLYFPRGILYDDPILRDINGTFVCNFSLPYRTPKGIIWFKFVAWDQMASDIVQNYRAGDKIIIAKAVPNFDKYKGIIVPSYTVYELDMSNLTENTVNQLTDEQLQEESEEPFDMEGLDELI